MQSHENLHIPRRSVHVAVMAVNLVTEQSCKYCVVVFQAKMSTYENPSFVGGQE